MPISKLRYPLRLRREDFTLLPLEALAMKMRVSCAFLRLCISAGCPLEEEKLSAATVLIWLFDHYAKVRALAGLKPAASVENLAPEVGDRLRLANALGTLLEYSRTRSSQWQHKRHFRRAMEQADRIADGHA